jgi:hypothetical protein
MAFSACADSAFTPRLEPDEAMLEQCVGGRGHRVAGRPAEAEKRFGNGLRGPIQSNGLQNRGIRGVFAKPH